MTIHPISISLLLLFSFYYTPTTATITPTDLFADDDDDVSINCGSRTAAAAANDARKWREDLQRAKGSSIDDKQISTVDPIPYKTARLSRSQFSYTFRLSPGQKTLRLHFNAAAYRGFRTSKDLFSVEAGAFALLRNFSASLTADALGVRSFFKEYCINIKNHQHLHIVFSAEATPSFDTYAFINGIEILSSPASLTYYKGGGDGKVKAVGISLVYVDETTALELVRRLNIRKDFVSDDGEMFGDREMVPKKESIKMKIYTWITSVDVGFQYLIRIHFSEVGLELVKIFGLTFELNINEMIVIDDTDVGIVAEMDDGISSPPLFRDYILMMNGYIREGKRDLMIYLQSSGGEFILGHGPIAGVEILKLSNPDNSLASPNPLPCMQDSSSLQPRQELLHRILGCRDMIATYAVALLALMIIIIYTLRVILEASFTEKETLLSARAQRVCRKFSLTEIMLATRSFSDAHFVGKGGFGNVYRGVINGCCEDVAIKRLKSSSKQGALEFLTEIETLSEMRHVNLVPLIGYCNDNGEMILVYEYMKNATLADHLYKLPNNGNVCLSLTWKQRLSICIGAGRGLDYLHTGHSFIHRDVKASNILLDEELVAKVSDFGLAKHLSRSKLQNHVSTKVKGTFWYMDPAYVTTGKLTKKSDVYAFGVLLLEVLSGRPAVDSSVSDEERVLTAWARENISDGNTERIVATNLRGEISKESLKAYVEIASRCLHGEPKKRPTMAQVVLDLEFALDQQERSKSVASYVITSRLNDNFPFEKMASFEPEPGRKDVKRAMVQKPSYLWQRGVLLKRGYNTMKAVRKSENMVAPAIPVDELKVKHGSNKQIINIPRISADELKEATDKFGYKCSILEGFHGRIYYAVLQSGQVAAVKKLDSRKQPLQEFLPKVSMIFSLRHEHVVELLACCVDGGLRVLAYEYAPNGSLHDVLHGKKGIKDSMPGPALSWRKRVNIAVGAAKGLAYIHDKAQIHGGIRSSNVLLFDDNEVAKITSFDLQYFNKKSNSLLGLKWFSSGRKYVSTSQKSWMSDVYSFGVVLLELLTGSKPIDHTQPLEQQDLVQWVKSKFCEDKVKECVDARLKGDYPPMAVVKMAEVAVSCTRDDAASRPHMSSVVDALQPLLDTAPREGLDDHDFLSNF